MTMLVSRMMAAHPQKSPWETHNINSHSHFYDISGELITIIPQFWPCYHRVHH